MIGGSSRARPAGRGRSAGRRAAARRAGLVRGGAAPGRRRRQGAPPRRTGAREDRPGGAGPRRVRARRGAALEAINRGEGSQALAYYERTGEQAGRDGNQVRAARAWHAATVTALRLGRFQKVIQDGGRAIEMFKAAGGLTPSDLGSWASVHAQLGSAYRAVGDLPRARATLEEGVALARTRMSGRREDQAEGYLLNGLAQVALRPAGLPGRARARHPGRAVLRGGRERAAPEGPGAPAHEAPPLERDLAHHGRSRPARPRPSRRGGPGLRSRAAVRAADRAARHRGRHARGSGKPRPRAAGLAESARHLPAGDRARDAGQARWAACPGSTRARPAR